MTSIDMLSSVLTTPRPEQQGQSVKHAPFEAGANALPRHFDQAKRTGAQDACASAIAFHGVAKCTFDIRADDVLSRMSMKSLTITPPRSRRRNWRAISRAADMLS